MSDVPNLPNVPELPFTKYSSIELLSNKKYVTKIAAKHNLVAHEFVALEKAHGAHASFQIGFSDVVNITFAKRTSVISNDTSFYGHVEVTNAYRERLTALWHRIQEMYASNPPTSIQVHGELIGGAYDHPDIPAQPSRSSRVQQEVDYCPGYEFYAYDIFLYFDNCVNTFMNYDECMKLFEELGFLYAKPLARGSLNDCGAYDPAFPTTIPAELGLPPIENNMAEGIVIKSVEPIRSIGGDGPQRMMPIFFKKKNARFSESYRERADNRGLKLTIPELEGVQAKIIRDVLLDMITENRLASVLSKEDESLRESGNVPRIAGLLASDIWNDYRRECQRDDLELSVLRPNERKLVSSAVTDNCRTLVNAYLTSATK